MATIFGSGDWGIDAEESGILISSLTFNYVNDSQELRNRTGDVIGKSDYNERVEVSIEGVLPSSSPFSTALASALALSNDIPDYLAGGVSTGTLIMEGANVKHEQEGYKAISIDAILYPLIT